MNKKQTLVWLIPLILLLLLIPFIVPSSISVAGAEADLPQYSPVILTNPHPGAVPTEEVPWNNQTREKVLYDPHADGFTRNENGLPCAYQDGTIYVRIDERVIQNTRVMFTWVQIADPSQFRAQFYTPYPSEGKKYATEYAKRDRAVLTMNGDYCVGVRQGVVIRNGTEFRKVEPGRYDQLIVDDEGDFHILRAPTLSDFEPFYGSILHSFVFGPALVINGELVDIGTEHDYVPNSTFKKKAQRQILCQMDKLSYLIITTEGPEQSKDGGFSLYDAAQLAYDCGAKQAYTMDGGSSTWLVLGTDRINNLKGRNLRQITDVVYFVTAEPDPAATPESAAETVPAAETP